VEKECDIFLKASRTAFIIMSQIAFSSPIVFTSKHLLARNKEATSVNEIKAS